MKRNLFYGAFILLLLISLNAHAHRMQVFLSWCHFMSPSNGPYVETYLAVNGKSVIYRPTAENKFQATIEVTMMFKQESNIVAFKKYNLLSPEIEDTSSIYFNFIDQQRFPLPNGVYDLEILISDLNNDNEKPFSGLTRVEFEFPDDKISVSGIELIDSYKPTAVPNILSKSGFDFVPYIFDFYPPENNKLGLYAEIYNANLSLGENEGILVNTFIESFESARVIMSLSKFKRETARPVIVVFQEFDISKLPSGNFNAVIEVRDKTNQILLARRLFFQRSNPNLQIEIRDIGAIEVKNTFASRINNIDSLKEYINSLYPISTELECIFAANQLAKSELRLLQQYFYNFWHTRDNINPEKAWQNYLTQVKTAESLFGTSIKRGYQTDRGRVYLQYGPPNTMTEQLQEPSAYPYEIWHYYTLNNQTNRKFVFYNPDLVTNDFELLHSDAIGEHSDYSWQLQLHRRDTPINDLDREETNDHWGSKSKEFFKDPR